MSRLDRLGRLVPPVGALILDLLCQVYKLGYCESLAER